jgi:hypothetical protein
MKKYTGAYILYAHGSLSVSQTLTGIEDNSLSIAIFSGDEQIA